MIRGDVRHYAATSLRPTYNLEELKKSAPPGLYNMVTCGEITGDLVLVIASSAGGGNMLIRFPAPLYQPTTHFTQNRHTFTRVLEETTILITDDAK